MGRLVQKVLYEGISSLCFCCGKLGHKHESCGLKTSQPNGEDAANVSLKTNEISEDVSPKPNYGPWMVVTRKRGPVRMGKASGPIKVDNSSQARVRGFSVLSQDSVQEEAGKVLDKSNQSDINPSDTDAPKEVTTRAVAAPNLQSDSVDSREDTTRVVAVQYSKTNLEMRKDCVMEDCIENPHAVCQQDTKQASGNKRKAVAKNKGKGSEGLGIRNSKGPKNSKSLKWLSHSTESKSELILSMKGLGCVSLVGNGQDSARVNPSATVRMGHLVHESYGGHSRRSNSSDTSCANGDSGLVRDRVGAGLEASISYHIGKHQTGKSTIGAHCLVPYTQPVVEVPDRKTHV